MPFQIWSCGGGTQSAAIAVLILLGQLPKPDYSVIADTGRETAETWEYLDNVINPALSRLGITVERIQQPHCPDLFNRKGTLLLPVFANGEAKFANFCSSYWKREIVKSWAVRKELLPALNWIGISTNEIQRLRASRAANWQLRYPLVFDFPMTRGACKELVRQYGWPEPPRSSCWMCPNRSDREWRHLRDNRPDEFASAVQLERDMRERKPDVFLHRSLVPLDQVDFSDDDSQGELFGCASGECFV